MPYNLPQHPHPLTSCHAQAGILEVPILPLAQTKLWRTWGVRVGGFLKLCKIFTHTHSTLPPALCELPPHNRPLSQGSL